MKEFWPVFRRLMLIVLTILAVFNIALSLLQSLEKPQVQSRLELYQTNLILQASEFKTEDSQTQELLQRAIAEDPYANAQKQYEQARDAAQTSRTTLLGQLQKLTESQPSVGSVATTSALKQQQQQLQQALEEAETFINEIDLKIGILQAQQGEIEAALGHWQAIANPPDIAQTAEALQQLWRSSASVSPETEAQIEQTLEGWFRDRALAQLYRQQQRPQALSTLETQQQTLARQALVKLAIIGGVPALAGLCGVGLSIFLFVQWVLHKERSVLGSSSMTWETPWDGETLWQVLVVGFFFVGQVVLPLLFSLLGFDPTGFNLRQKAILVLASYLLLAAGGLSVLYVSIKPFFPLPEGWFRFKFPSNWIVWGVGGYCVAIPLVVIVSLLNQQIWQGQGGSNPILSLALQAQDLVALGIFFFTASVAAPVFEEIIFRGFLLPSLTRYLPLWGAIATSSVVFAIAHLSFSEVLPLAALGIVLGTVYARSRNLLSSILLHSLWNSGTLLTLFVLGS